MLDETTYKFHMAMHERREEFNSLAEQLYDILIQHSLLLLDVEKKVIEKPLTLSKAIEVIIGGMQTIIEWIENPRIQAEILTETLIKYRKEHSESTSPDLEEMIDEQGN